MHVRVVKIMKINLGMIWLLYFKSAGSSMEYGNCNIITEILLVISYTTSYGKKLYYYSN